MIQAFYTVQHLCFVWYAGENTKTCVQGAELFRGLCTTEMLFVGHVFDVLRMCWFFHGFKTYSDSFVFAGVQPVFSQMVSEVV